MARNRPFLLVLAIPLAFALPDLAAAQPFGTPARWLSVGTGDGYVEVPSHPELTPARQLTIEFWGRLAARAPGAGCDSFVTKDFTLWVGVCNGELRSYLRSWLGYGCEVGKVIYDGFPHHYAVSFDGDRRRHYIDGEFVGSCADPDPLVADNHPLRFFHNPRADAHTPREAILFEVRLWSVARSKAQIRSTMTREIDGPTPGLVSAWHLRNDTRDAVGGHHGSAPQAGAGFAQQPPIFTCFTSADVLCLLGRLQVYGTFAQYSAPFPDGHRDLLSYNWARTVPGASTDAGLFWFFRPENWEVLVKAVDGCALNRRHWVFSAATTDVHYTLWVIDGPSGAVRPYVNFAGSPAPAVTDTSAFANCP